MNISTIIQQLAILGIDNEHSQHIQLNSKLLKHIIIIEIYDEKLLKYKDKCDDEEILIHICQRDNYNKYFMEFGNKNNYILYESNLKVYIRTLLRYCGCNIHKQIICFKDLDNNYCIFYDIINIKFVELEALQKFENILKENMINMSFDIYNLIKHIESNIYNTSFTRYTHYLNDKPLKGSIGICIRIPMEIESTTKSASKR